MTVLFTMNADVQTLDPTSGLVGLPMEIYFDLDIGGGWAKSLGSPRASFVSAFRATGYIRSDGRMHTTPDSGGTLGIRLIANDPNLRIDSPLTYTVSGKVTSEPWRIPFEPFSVAAPGIDGAVDLASLPTFPPKSAVATLRVTYRDLIGVEG